MIKIFLIAGLILYVIPLLAIFLFQRSFMYFPPDIYLSPDGVGLQATEKEFSLGAGGATAWWLPPKDEKPVIIFFHGNGSAVFSNHHIYAELAAQGYGVLGAGYVGYPSSSGQQGKPSQRAIVDIAVQQYDYLIDYGIPPEHIIFYGTSLGSGVAAQLAARRKPAMLISEAPFNSALDLGRKSMPIFPVQWLMKDTYKSDAAIKDLDIPFVWMHGTNDAIIPLSQGQKLFDSYTGPKTHKIFEGGQHTNLWTLGGRDFVIKNIEGLNTVP